MKTIKKVAIAVAVAVVVSTASFAVDYSGDIQFQLGWQGATTTVGDAGGEFAFGGDLKFQSKAFYIADQNWNLWNINDLFSVGFYEKVDLGVGGGSKIKMGDAEADLDYTRVAINFLIGPAVGIRAGNIAKFQIGVGFVGGYEVIILKDFPSGVGSIDSTRNLVLDSGVIGFGLDLQAKFIPRSVVSPLIGFQYAYRGEGSYTVSIQDSSIPSSNVNAAFNAHSCALYVGASINWGAR